MLRWLLPIIAAISIACSSAVSFAAAGWIGDTECCCPIKAKCKCHDHDGEHHPPAKLKRCGGEAKLVAPVVVTAVEAPPIEVGDVPRTLCRQARLPAPVLEDRPVEIETPPF